MPCPGCGREREETVTYEQVIRRGDDFSSGGKKRSYEISYREEYGSKVLFRTERCRSLRGALTEAREKLNELEVKT